MPLRLLPLLTAAPQSGDQLGQGLGIGRVSVNTLARRLQEDGVPVNITRAGYALEAGTPAPGLVPLRGQFGRALLYRGTVTSTQDELRAWADAEDNPAPHGAVVVAERQTAGRGRRGRAWDTTHGTLAFSLLLREALTLPELAQMPLAAGVALHAACTALGVPCGLKWPNDLLTPTPSLTSPPSLTPTPTPGTGLAPEGRKLAGILLEADLRGEEARRAVLGIGINVSAAPEGAACLQHNGASLSRAEVLAGVLFELEHWLTQPAPTVLAAWKAASLTLGRPVRVITARAVVEGVARDLDGQGNLLVETQTGVQSVSAGDVQLVGTFPPDH